MLAVQQAKSHILSILSHKAWGLFFYLLYTSILLILQNSLNNLYFSTQCDYSLFMPKFLFGNCFQELLVINESHFYVDNPIYIIYHQNILRYRHRDILYADKDMPFYYIDVYIDASVLRENNQWRIFHILTSEDIANVIDSFLHWIYIIKKITRWLEDMHFIFEWWKQYFTNQRGNWVKPPCNILLCILLYNKKKQKKTVNLFIKQSRV